MTRAELHDLASLLVVFGMPAIFVSVGRIFYEWKHLPDHDWQPLVGRIMVSIVAAWATGLSLAQSMRHDPVLIVLVLGAAWGGERVMARVTEATEDRLGRKMPPPPGGPPKERHDA